MKHYLPWLIGIALFFTPIWLVLFGFATKVVCHYGDMASVGGIGCNEGISLGDYGVVGLLMIPGAAICYVFYCLVKAGSDPIEWEK